MVALLALNVPPHEGQGGPYLAPAEWLKLGPPGVQPPVPADADAEAFSSATEDRVRPAAIPSDPCFQFGLADAGYRNFGMGFDKGHGPRHQNYPNPEVRIRKSRDWSERLRETKLPKSVSQMNGAICWQD
jgi:hypothetical protein